MGDQIGVYGQGRIEQFDMPAPVLGTPATPHVAQFVGADRGLKRLSVTTIEPDDLEQPPVARLDEPAAAAAARLRADGGRWAVVLGGDGDLHGWVAALDGSRFLGVLTPAKPHEALRRSVDADARGGWRGTRSSSTRSRTRENPPR